MTISILTLNIQIGRHLERVRALLTTLQPDVVCLQEVPEVHCVPLALDLGYRSFFAPSVLHDAAQDSCWGVAMLTRLPVRHVSMSCYSQDAAIRTLQQPNDPRRMLVAAELQHATGPYRVMTTHFTWSDRGRASREQFEDFDRLKAALQPHSGYVLCGDFNAPRGGEVHARFLGELQLKDNLPQHIVTTIDGSLHHAGALQLVVDTIFSTPGYLVSDVQVFDGVSDHMAILASVRRAS